MQRLKEILEIVFIFLRLGLTSFGGPVAHLGFFHETFVRKRQWISESAYAGVVGLCQALPGPASSQVGMSVGLMRAGVGGALAAWAGFTLPSACLMIAFALSAKSLAVASAAGVLHGLKLAALAVVAHAVVAMTQKLCPDTPRRLLSLLLASILVFIPHPAAQLLAMGLGAVLGILFFPELPLSRATSQGISVSRMTSAAALVLLLTLLISVQPLAAYWESPLLALFGKFFRVGTLVFGGGHVVLPLLAGEFTGPDGISSELFLAGYGAAQALPGPLFSFAAFVGAALSQGASPILFAAVALVGIFLPSFLLLCTILPFWHRLSDFHAMRKALSGLNAAVVGLLAAAWASGFTAGPALKPFDVAIIVAGFCLLQFLRWPSWSVVGLSALLCR